MKRYTFLLHPDDYEQINGKLVPSDHAEVVPDKFGVVERGTTIRIDRGKMEFNLIEQVSPKAIEFRYPLGPRQFWMLDSGVV